MRRAFGARLARLQRIVDLAEPRCPVEILPETERRRLRAVAEARRTAPDAPIAPADEAWFKEVAMPVLAAMPAWRAAHAAWAARVAAWRAARARFPAFSLQMQERTHEAAVAAAW